MSDLLYVLFKAISAPSGGIVGALAAVGALCFFVGCLLLVGLVLREFVYWADRRNSPQHQSPVRIVSKRIEEGYWSTIWYGDAYCKDLWIPRRFIVRVSLDTRCVECSVTEEHYERFVVGAWTQLTFSSGRLTDTIYPISIMCPSSKPASAGNKQLSPARSTA